VAVSPSSNPSHSDAVKRPDKKYATLPLASPQPSLAPHDLLLLLHNAPVILAIINPSHTLCYCNSAITDLLGYPIETIQGKNLFTLIHPEDIPTVTAILDLLIQTPGAVQSLEFRCRHSQGTWRVLEGRGRGVQENHTEPYITLTLRDVTEQKWVNEKQHLAKREWEQAIDALSDLVLLTNAAGTVRRCNQAVSQTFHLPYLDLIDRPIWEVLYSPAEPVAAIFRELSTTPAAQESQREEIYLPRLGSWLTVTRHPVRLSGSEAFQGFAYILTDVTERKRREEMLREQVLQPHDVAGRLREFRKTLNLSQKAFGQTFGEYSQRQMNSYESGETEIPIGLLLAMKNKGYSLDVVLAPSRGDIFNRLMEQLSLSAKTRGVVQQLLEALSRILTQEQQTLDILLKKLGLPRAPTATPGHLFVQDFLAHTGILPDDTLEQDPLPSSPSPQKP
jgi:PAS domain S-box-containing protein